MTGYTIVNMNGGRADRPEDGDGETVEDWWTD